MVRTSRENERFSLDAARRLAAYAIRHSGAELESQIRTVYQYALGRNPSSDELEFATQFLDATKRRLNFERRNATSAEALTDFCLVLFNVNEFIYID